MPTSLGLRSWGCAAPCRVRAAVNNLDADAPQCLVAKHHDAYDVSIKALMETFMRTTLTLDPDIKAMLTELAFRQGKTFKATVNDTLRTGLGKTKVRGVKRAPPATQVYSMGKPLVDLSKANSLADDLDDQDFVAKSGRQK